MYLSLRNGVLQTGGGISTAPGDNATTIPALNAVLDLLLHASARKQSLRPRRCGGPIAQIGS